MSFSEASWTGLLNLRSLEWDAPLLSRLPVAAAALPKLADLGEGAVRGLAPPYAERWPVDVLLLLQTFT